MNYGRHLNGRGAVPGATDISPTNPQSSMGERARSSTFETALLGLVTLGLIAISIFFAVNFFEGTIALVAGKVATHSDLSFLLLKGLVIVGTIPFFWSIAKFTQNVWRLVSQGWDAVAIYKNKYGLAIVGYVGLYFFVTYAASLQAYQDKFCADTPEGVFTSDSPGKDPVYGIELKACSRVQTLTLRAGRGLLKPPREISIADAGSYEWFDRVTGQPRVWYSVAGEHSYRFFDAHGVDPYSRQELKPVTPDIAEKIKNQQSAMATAQRAAQTQATDSNLRKIAATRQGQQDSEVEALARQAESSFESKDYKSAIETCSQVLATMPRNQTCTSVKQHASTKLSGQYVNQGLAHWEKGEFDEAKWSADKALDLDPTNQSAIKLKKLADQMKSRVNQ